MGNGNSRASHGKEPSSHPNDRKLDRLVPKKLRRDDFEKGFIFGSSTAAYQIEGGADEGGRGPSIWDKFTLDTPEHIKDGSNGNVAADQYHMYKEDVELMKKVGLDAYRFSISWSRILPEGRGKRNQEGIDYYHDLIDKILDQGMVPYVTLFHWDLPLALEQEYGGFLHKRIVDDFCEYAKLCFLEYGDKVKYWITINEAWTYTVRGYAWGSFPPGRGALEPQEMVHKMAASVLHKQGHKIDHDELKDYVGEALQDARHFSSWRDVAEHADEFLGDAITSRRESIDYRFVKDIMAGLYIDYKTHKKAERGVKGSDPSREPYRVAHNFLLAHAAVVQCYKEDYRGDGKIGMTNNANWYLPYHEDDEGDKEAAERAVDFMLGWFVAPLVTGKYPKSMRKRVGDRLPRFSKKEQEMVKGSYDFLGINYYTTYYATSVETVPHKILHYDIDKDFFSTPTQDGHPIGPQAGSDWLYIYPQGLYYLLVYIMETYRNPLIYITENGVDEKDDPRRKIYDTVRDPVRIDYHYDHLRYMREAIKEGVNVRAYFIWSFADNFEWDEGYSVRFGIFYVDYEDDGRKRYHKSSVLWWKSFMNNYEVYGSEAMNLLQGDDDLEEERTRTRTHQQGRRKHLLSDEEGDDADEDMSTRNNRSSRSKQVRHDDDDDDREKDDRSTRNNRSWRSKQVQNDEDDDREEDDQPTRNSQSWRSKQVRHDEDDEREDDRSTRNNRSWRSKQVRHDEDDESEEDRATRNNLSWRSKPSRHDDDDEREKYRSTGNNRSWRSKQSRHDDEDEREEDQSTRNNRRWLRSKPLRHDEDDEGGEDQSNRNNWSLRSKQVRHDEDDEGEDDRSTRNNRSWRSKQECHDEDNEGEEDRPTRNNRSWRSKQVRHDEDDEVEEDRSTRNNRSWRSKSLCHDEDDKEEDRQTRNNRSSRSKSSRHDKDDKGEEDQSTRSNQSWRRKPLRQDENDESEEDRSTKNNPSWRSNQVHHDEDDDEEEEYQTRSYEWRRRKSND